MTVCERMQRGHPIRVMSVATLTLALWLLAVACTTPPALAPSRTRITLVADGQQQRIETDAVTVRQLLNEAGITIGELDRVSPPETSALVDGLTVSVVRVTQTTFVVTQTIPFEKQIVRDATVPNGESRLLQSGQPGLLEYHYRITYEDGQEVGRALVKETTVQAPAPEVRLVGTRAQVENREIEGALAYLSHQDAWVIRESTFQRRRLTFSGDLDGRAFALSPDGQWLLFSTATTDTEQLNELWMITTNLTTATPVPLDVSDVLWAGWAPDGDAIAWSTAEIVAQAPGWRGNNDLWQATVTTRQTLTARRQIIEPEPGGGYGWWGTRYVWAPDGTSLAYGRPDGVGVVERRSGEQASLLRFPALRTFSSWAWNPLPAWTPDGSFLVSIVHTPSGDNPEESPVFNLVAIESSGAYSATLAPEVGMWSAPQPSPAGNAILFGRAIIPYQSAISHYTLHLIDIDGSGQRMLYSGESGDGLELPEWIWAPSGTAVAFVEFGDVYMLSLGDTVPVILTDEGDVSQICWR